MKHIVCLALIIASFFGCATPAQAIVNPLAVPNNHFGIHITDINDIPAARDLVNSSGGDWGYVTFVIREDDRDLARWQEFFDLLRQNHLIPIVRLATHMTSSHWTKPSLESASEWVGFLEDLNWLTKNRYIVLFNEPNHAKEWGGSINPEEYARVAAHYSQALKTASPDYFILPAGLDAAATTGGDTLHIEHFLSRMHSEVPDIFSYFDGWTSHAYPNPHFSGSPYDKSRMSIKSYIWELNYISKLGFSRDKPIFITETGWIHNGGLKNTNTSLTTDKIASYYQTAFEDVWIEDNIVAITPFILNYPSSPFDQFSFRSPHGDEFLPHYHAVASLEKPSGQPLQIHQAEFVSHGLPRELIADTRYSFTVTFQNTGQSIWTPQDTFLIGTYDDSDLQIPTLTSVMPGDTAQFHVSLAPTKLGINQLNLNLTHHGQKIDPSLTIEFSLYPPTNLVAKMKLWLHRLHYPGSFQFSLLHLDTLNASSGYDHEPS